MTKRFFRLLHLWLGLLSGMAGYGAAMRLEGSRKEYALSYLACSIPVIAILSLISILT